MKLLIQCLAVAVGGSLGAVLRFLVATLCGRWFGTEFPIGTFAINITGSLFLGWFFEVMQQRSAASDTLRVGVAVGIVGAYTTFSTFAYESHALLENGNGLKALFNMFGSVLLGLVAVRLGILLGGR